MSLPSANNPLDAILYPTSETWLPSKKPVDLSFKGTAPKNVKFSIPPIRIKNLNVFIDVEKARRNKRTELLNRKAFLLEKSQNDMIEQNDIERRYAEQQAELKKLENLFANSLLAGVMENVVINSKNNILGQYFRDDPDISNFDKETEDVKTDAKNLLNLQESNAKLIQSINQSRQELENLIQQQIGEAQNDTEVEALEQSINELEAIAVIPEEEIAEPTEVIEELDDDVIEKEMEQERQLEEQLKSTQEQLEEVRRKRGRPKKTEEQREKEKGVMTTEFMSSLYDKTLNRQVIAKQTLEKYVNEFFPNLKEDLKRQLTKAEIRFDIQQKMIKTLLDEGFLAPDTPSLEGDIGGSRLMLLKELE